MLNDYLIQKLLLDMKKCLSLVDFANQEANHDITQFGEWRSDHSISIYTYLEEYNSLEKEFNDLLKLEALK